MGVRLGRDGGEGRIVIVEMGEREEYCREGEEEGCGCCGRREEDEAVAAEHVEEEEGEEAERGGGEIEDQEERI